MLHFGRKGPVSACVLPALLVAACNGHPAVPDIPRPAAITAHLQTSAAWGKVRDKKVEVREKDIDRIYAIVKPVEWIPGGVDRSKGTMIARLHFKYPDRPNIELIVRSGGRNPAAVSLDDRVFYWGREGGPPGDGGAEVLIILIADEQSR